ncbi:hypothetical protein IFM89_013183 [Coptis chinensis]|uniref:Copper ion binding protein n=1 Tax=Coptis chinensis TaxID=261450 RepID=A0A835LU59_9MAGN|nr:hypothetical protein IFM89_013183 [Coptis chinensis]
MIRTKLNPLISSTLSSQFLQKCSVSGTAKGKGKVKDGAGPLKRSVVPKKKGGGGGGAAKTQSPTEGGGRVDKMVDSCLTASTPIRYLTPKQKSREAEREKLGLISKGRQRELDEMKLKKNGKEEDKAIMGTPGLDLISLGLVDAEKIPKYELTVEDGRRLAKEYSRVLMRQHRKRRAAETNLLKLKKEAIQALPDNLKVAALIPDLTPFPVNRYMATLTPPIDGYSESINAATNKKTAKKLR